MADLKRRSLAGRIARILLILAVSLLLAAWLLPPLARRLVMEQIHERLPEGDTLYYTGHTISLLPFHLQLRDLCLESPSSGLSLSATKLEVAASWNDLLRGLGLKLLLVSDGELVVSKPRQRQDGQDAPSADRRFVLDDIRVRNMDIRLLQGVQPVRFRIDSLRSTLAVETRAGSQLLVPDTAALALQLSGLEIPGIFSHHRLDIASVSKLPASAWNISALAIHSTKKRAFFDAQKQMNPRIDWQVDSVRIAWRLDTISSEHGMHLSACQVKGHRLEVYQNTGLPPTGREKKLLPSLLKAIAFPFSLDTLQLDAGELIYEERTAADKAPARLSIDQWTLSGASISNQSDGADMLLKSRMRLMKECILTASCRFPDQAPDDHFIFQGKLSHMYFHSLNDLVGPVSGFSFTKGRLHAGTFHFFGNNYHARGRMKLEYENLRVGRYGRKRNKLFSWVAGAAVHKHGKGREAEINVRRLPNRSMVHFWSRAIESGIKDHIIRWD